MEKLLDFLYQSVDQKQILTSTDDEFVVDVIKQLGVYDELHQPTPPNSKRTGLLFSRDGHLYLFIRFYNHPNPIDNGYAMFQFKNINPKTANMAIAIAPIIEPGSKFFKLKI